jgi:hypothetical protein
MKVYQLQAKSSGANYYTLATFVCNDDVKPDALMLTKLAVRGYQLLEYVPMSPISSEALTNMCQDEVCADMDAPYGEWPEPQ